MKTQKTQSHRDACMQSWLLVNLKQFEKRRYPYYIACQKVAYDKVRILGFISLENVQKLSIENYGLGPGYSAESLNQLRQVIELKDLEPKRA